MGRMDAGRDGLTAKEDPGGIGRVKKEETMPFSAGNFQKNIETRIEGPLRDELIRACQVYVTLTRPKEKAGCIRQMMAALDREAGADTRKGIMQACGRSCLCASVIEKARRLQAGAQNLDELLDRLNRAHIGGGHLRRQGQAIHAAYDRCYCGSVSQTRQPFSATYCLCSCGWYRGLFEALLQRPVEVELLGSIIQGDENCQFLIHL